MGGEDLTRREKVGDFLLSLWKLNLKDKLNLVQKLLQVSCQCDINTREQILCIRYNSKCVTLAFLPPAPPLYPFLCLLL